MSATPKYSSSSGKPLRLLQTVPNEVYSRLIVRYPHQTDRDYALFYREAATRLAGTYSGQPIDDTILMPFLMLYRQAFELQLKNFIRYLASVRRRYHDSAAPSLSSDVVGERLKKTLGHNLAKLLNELLKHYEALDLAEPFPSGVKKVIQMLHEADQRGTAFRYSGEMPESQDRADFPALAALLDEELGKLIAVEDWIDSMYSAAPSPEEFE
ncbi:hypothetical protein [Pseudonocardia humida]|uniref:HEPN AbiU2-like domain-containing protein n=1 Tax=Pseudonocardia humida TaxID=2800819 RepID=A0ABT1A2F4_9PSEU|nr:hypothetical protein [Pseudonocardia humida]MCO1657123.1 hypothetical protein [Pseudonocardia humida]